MTSAPSSLSAENTPGHTRRERPSPRRTARPRRSTSAQRQLSRDFSPKKNVGINGASQPEYLSGLQMQRRAGSEAEATGIQSIAYARNCYGGGRASGDDPRGRSRPHSGAAGASGRSRKPRCAPSMRPCAGAHFRRADPQRWPTGRHTPSFHDSTLGRAVARTLPV